MSIIQIQESFRRAKVDDERHLRHTRIVAFRSCERTSGNCPFRGAKDNGLPLKILANSNRHKLAPTRVLGKAVFTTQPPSRLTNRFFGCQRNLTPISINKTQVIPFGRQLQFCTTPQRHSHVGDRAEVRGAVVPVAPISQAPRRNRLPANNLHRGSPLLLLCTD